MTIRQSAAKTDPGHRDGPLVPLDGKRFRVALDESGLGLAGLVRALNKGRRPLDRSYKQTLHHHYQGKGSRIRAKVRQQLARVLDAPEEWLAGEEVQAPLGLYLQLMDPMRRSLRVQLAVTRLAWRCYEAVERDLAAEPPRPPTAEGYEPGLVVHQVMGSTLARLVNVVRGLPRLVALGRHLYAPTGLPPVQTAPEPLPVESPLLGNASREPLPPAVEQAYLASVRVVTDLLQAWLAGDRPLNYSALLDVADAVNPGVRAVSPPPFRHAGPRDIRAWHRAASTSPFTLIDWPTIEGRVPPKTPSESPTSRDGRGIGLQPERAHSRASHR